MPLLMIYFELHQPRRLHPERDKFLWEEMDRKIFERVADKCYLPATKMFTELLKGAPGFKITLSMSGTFLEQAEAFRPDVIRALQDMLDAGQPRSQVEFLNETYFHSLSSLFAAPHKREFREQVSLHRDKMKQIFGITPASFVNTELMYNNEIARVVADMGYSSILCEKREDMFQPRDGAVSPNAIFRAAETDLIVIPRNREISDDVAFRFPQKPVSPAKYARSIAMVDGEAVMLGYDYEHIGEHIWEDRGIFEFWLGLPTALAAHESIQMVTATETAERFRGADCPIADIPGLSTSSWADTTRDTSGWLGTHTQYELFKDIERLEVEARRAGGEFLTKWRYLTTSDHVYFLHETHGHDQAVHSYFNPYGGSIAEPAFILTRKIDDLDSAMKRFEILKKRKRTAVLIISPETGRLPEEMGPLARYISGKSGGQGEVVSALCEGLTEREIEVHIATLNLKKRFQRESQMNETEWREVRYRIYPEKIHLVSSSYFADNLSAYEGDTRLTAAEFQKEIVNNIIKTVRAKCGGKLIVHSHDWMAGGVIIAYARTTGLPVLHTVHNVFTGHVPLDMLSGIDLNSIAQDIFYSREYGKVCVDCQATAIKNANLINFVGREFLREVVNDYFMDRPIIPPSVRQEVKAKYYHNAALSILNAPSQMMYPERSPGLVRNYGPGDDVLRAKRENLVEFQRRLGLQVNPDAILLYWPSRLDPSQKGVELLEDIALKFVIEHGDVQIGIVGEGVGGDRTHEEILGRIAWASDGKIALRRFEEDLSMLGFAAANDVFGASLYEPCGQIDQVGNLFGATATNRDTGGYHDKIRELQLKIHGATQDTGNGFLFRSYDPGGLWYGLHNSVEFHRLPPEIREPQIKRIMNEAREQYDLERMIAAYIRVYERLNGGKPLV